MTTRCVCPADVALDETAGGDFEIEAVASNIRRGTNEGTLHAIHQYLKTNLRMLEPATWDHPGRGRKTSLEILRDGAWGCSAHAQVACHLARATGIPAILVKSMKVGWRNQGDGRGEGHVYVEVLIDGKPALWDAQGGRLHVDYNPESVITPDGLRRIYQKGSPDGLVLSHHGCEWEAETNVLFPRNPSEKC